MEGRKAKAYYNTGTYGTPVWTEIKRGTDWKRPQSRSTSDIKYRGANNVKTAQGYRKYEVSFTYRVKRQGLADTVLAALQASFDAETTLDVVLVDRAIATTGAYGIRGPFVVSKFDRNEPDEDGISYDVMLSEVDDEQAGALVEVAPYTTP